MQSIRSLVNSFARRDRARLIAETLIIVLSVGLITVLELNGNLSSGQLAVFAVVITAVISLEVLQSRVEKVLTAVRYGPQVFNKKTIVDDRLRRYIEDESPDDLYLMEYSSANAQEVIRAGVEAGCSIYLLVRHPDTNSRWNVSEKQSRRILETIHQNYYEQWIEDDEFDLQIRFSHRPAGLRARRADDDYLLCGWYTFGHRDDRKSAETKRVQGKQNPFVAFPSDNQDYQKLNEMFEKSFFSLWRQGEDLQSIYDRSPSVLGDYPERLDSYEEWVTAVSGTDEAELFDERPWMERIESVDPAIFYDEPQQMNRAE